MTIQQLASDVAGKIAAGEVVERPANVAKELVENSLDAGATEIEVEIREGGQRLLRVRDDGCGIESDQLGLALRRHATSKLRNVEDLESIRTFGFRGEALYSIAAVSRLTVSSRHRSEEAGRTLRAEGGSILNTLPAGLPIGTVVSVEHLFFNTPARKKFLRRPATEAGHIRAIVERYALAHPDRRFRLVSDDRLLFESSGTGDLADVLVQVYGRENGSQMIPVGAERYRGGEDAEPGEVIDFMGERETGATERPGTERIQPLLISGYVSLPSLTRAGRTKIDLFVNRRYIEDRSLTHAVVQAYHTLLPAGRFPLAVLFVDMDPAEVDVNVHPRKTEVRFRDARRIFSGLQRSVRQVLLQHAPVPDYSIPTRRPGDESENAPGVFQIEDWVTRRETILRAGQREMDFRLEPTVSEAEHESAQERREDENRERESLQNRSEAEPGRDPLPPLRVVGQVGATYIVAEGPQGLYLIDQHAAHERIMYEQFMQARSEDGIARQGLLDPLPLHVGQERTGLVVEYLEALEGAGFQIEPFGGDTFLVRSVPSVLAKRDPLRILDEIIDGLLEERNRVEEEIEAQLIKMVCKRASIKAGQVLSDIEMSELLRQLEGCVSPRTCPHGRPTMVQLSAGQLEKAFKRV